MRALDLWDVDVGTLEEAVPDVPGGGIPSDRLPLPGRSIGILTEHHSAGRRRGRVGDEGVASQRPTS